VSILVKRPLLNGRIGVECYTGNDIHVMCNDKHSMHALST